MAKASNSFLLQSGGKLTTDFQGNLLQVKSKPL
jgi:hypothetical protein